MCEFIQCELEGMYRITRVHITHCQMRKNSYQLIRKLLIKKDRNIRDRDKIKHIYHIILLY